MRAIRRGRAPFMALLRHHVAALLTRPDLLPTRTLTALTIVEQGLGGGWAARARAMFVPGLVRQTWAETLMFRLWLLMG